MTVKRIAAGFRILRYGVLDSSGKFIGNTATAPAAGVVAGSGMLRLDGARTLPVNIAEPDTLAVSGDDEPMVQFEFDSENLPSGVIDMAARDNVFEALIQGTKNQTIGDIEVGVLDPKDRSSQTMCLLLSRRAKSWKSGERGAKKWENLYIPTCTIKPLYLTVEQRTFNPYQYAINLSRSDRTGWSTINITEHGTTASSLIPIDSDNPLNLHRFTGDNSTTGFTLDIAPLSGAKTYVYVNDLRQAVTTDYTISGTSLNFVVAPASAAVIQVLYEFDEANLV